MPTTDTPAGDARDELGEEELRDLELAAALAANFARSGEPGAQWAGQYELTVPSLIRCIRAERATVAALRAALDAIAGMPHELVCVSVRHDDGIDLGRLRCAKDCRGCIAVAALAALGAGAGGGG